MNKVVISMALLLAIGAPSTSAIAQSGNSGSNASQSSGVLPAPVGHRQPRASDVPDEKNISNPSDPVNKEDALLDKKIKSICRGC